jgi:exodeoxyribonuclease VII large subunit
LSETIKTRTKKLEKLSKRLSPVKLASNLGDKKTQLARLEQKNIAAVRAKINFKDEGLKIEMASLDALSPLSVLSRGFSIVKTEKDEILRDSAKVKINDKLKIQLANGKLEARVIDKE